MIIVSKERKKAFPARFLVEVLSSAHQSLDYCVSKERKIPASYPSSSAHPGADEASLATERTALAFIRATWRPATWQPGNLATWQPGGGLPV